MPHYVEWDAAHPDERVTRVRRSEDAARYQGSGVVMSDAELRVLREQEPTRYWRHDTGAIRVMDAAEKARAVAEDEAAGKRARTAEAQRQVVGAASRATMSMLLPTINHSRLLRGEEALTIEELVAAVRAEVSRVTEGR